MNVIGIAAEYNPFHHGHALHIARARALLGKPNVPVVAVLSSAFTQRGLPALADKWTRTRMALSNGVDLVLELPFVHACNGGVEFASGAVDILAGTGFVTHISFGMERPFDPEMPPLGTILDILVQEPASFKLHFKENLASGQSYPKAVAGALNREFSWEGTGSGDLVSTPNNSLALSYLLHIRRKRYGLIPLPVRREGAGYHDGRPGESGGGKEKLAGAAAIRKGLLSGEAWTAGAVPASVSVLLEEAKTNGRLCLDGAGTKILWTLLCGLLLRSTPEDLREASGMDEGLENLFLKHFLHAASYEDFIGRCVSARYTRGRLQRASIRLLTGFGRHVSALSREGPPYIRVLGFNRHGRELLRGAASALPFITRLPAARLSAKYGEAAGRYAEMEYRASRLWELLVPASDPRHEEKQRPVGL